MLLKQYHGGTNFDRTAGQFIATSYDYDAPLDEYGNFNSHNLKTNNVEHFLTFFFLGYVVKRIIERT